jgi:hypothetical protein
MPEMGYKLPKQFSGALDRFMRAAHHLSRYVIAGAVSL